MRNRTALAGAVALLLAANVTNNRLAPRASVPASLAGTALLLTLARRAGRSPADLGFAHAGRGLRHGALAAGAISVVYAAGAALPATRQLFADERAAEAVAGLLRQMLVDVPLGTVLLEETGFRAVLPALLREECGELKAEAICAALFGLWHILPSADLAAANPALAEAAAGGGAVSAVVMTAAGGVLFAGLRRGSGSVLAPAVLHTAINSLGYLAAWLVKRGEAGAR